jgi:hypothetical protein
MAEWTTPSTTQKWSSSFSYSKHFVLAIFGAFNQLPK